MSVRQRNSGVRVHAVDSRLAFVLNAGLAREVPISCGKATETVARTTSAGSEGNGCAIPKTVYDDLLQDLKAKIGSSFRRNVHTRDGDDFPFPGYATYRELCQAIVRWSGVDHRHVAIAKCDTFWKDVTTTAFGLNATDINEVAAKLQEASCSWKLCFKLLCNLAERRIAIHPLLSPRHFINKTDQLLSQAAEWTRKHAIEMETRYGVDEFYKTVDDSTTGVTKANIKNYSLALSFAAERWLQNLGANADRFEWVHQSTMRLQAAQNFAILRTILDDNERRFDYNLLALDSVPNFLTHFLCAARTGTKIWESWSAQDVREAIQFIGGLKGQTISEPSWPTDMTAEVSSTPILQKALWNRAYNVVTTFYYRYAARLEDFQLTGPRNEAAIGKRPWEVPAANLYVRPLTKVWVNYILKILREAGADMRVYAWEPQALQAVLVEDLSIYGVDERPATGVPDEDVGKEPGADDTKFV